MNNYINDINSAGEWARLDHQARIVGKRTGLLPSHFDDVELTRVLDVGCGPGRWTLDIAFDRPDAEVTGIDLSADLVAYAKARARTQHLRNVSFDVQDFLTTQLPFPEHTFDLIHLRFAVSWIKREQWVLVLARSFALLKPEGWIVVTEGEGMYTTSPALERLQEVLCDAFSLSGYGLSSSPRSLGVVARLSALLAETGFRKIWSDATVIDYSFHRQEANMEWRESFHALISESASFLLDAGVTTAEDLAQLDKQIGIDMYQEDFCGIGPIFTISAQKPRGETADEH
jgi:SAM-dependent methyltransferase